MPTLHQNIKIPASDFTGWMASLINTVMGLPGGGAAMVTAIQAAADVATLRTAIENLAVHAKDKHFTRELSNMIASAHALRLFGATDSAAAVTIAALLTVNTADLQTDLLYLLAKQYDTTNNDKFRYGHHATFVTVP